MDVNYNVLFDALEATKYQLTLKLQDEVYDNKANKIRLRIMQLEIWMREISVWMKK